MNHARQRLDSNPRSLRGLNMRVSRKIEQPELPSLTHLEACEIIYRRGLADEVSGDVKSPTGHFYRVGRCIVWTDAQGYRSLAEHESVTDARHVFEEATEEYAAWSEWDA